MAEFLLFRLYGPMAAWGDIAVGEYRPSFERPSKSAILGLFAAALGIRRDEEDKQYAIASAYRLAVKVDALGTLLRDYHTVQRPRAEKHAVYHTRKDELLWGKSKLTTTISTRDYRCEAFYSVCVWISRTDMPSSLHELRAALKAPKFSLYMGRKSCPLALPLNPQVVSADTVMEAFTQADFGDNRFRKAMADSGVEFNWPKVETVSWYWDDDSNVETGWGDAARVFTRRDVPLSRRRWQFGERPENHKFEGE